MAAASSRTLKIEVDGAHSVTGRLIVPQNAIACFVFAHGAGAGMTHPFMETAAAGLSERKIATLRFQFPYMEAGSKRPDRPALAHAAVRAAVEQAAHSVPDLPLFAGGKSFGGRMSSQAQASAPLKNVRGLIFLGFPLHPTGKPSSERAEHLSKIDIPMLFLQGTHDKLAESGFLGPLIRKLGRMATLHTLENADHSFHVPAKSGRKDSDVMTEILDAIAAWIVR